MCVHQRIIGIFFVLKTRYFMLSWFIIGWLLYIKGRNCLLHSGIAHNADGVFQMSAAKQVLIWICTFNIMFIIETTIKSFWKWIFHSEYSCRYKNVTFSAKQWTFSYQRQIKAGIHNHSDLHAIQYYVYW